MKINFYNLTEKILKKSFFFIFLTAAFFLHSQQAGKNSADSDWIIAVAEFKTEGLPSIYQNYKTVIPQMFLLNLNKDAERLVPFEERKMRQMMDVSLKKINLIKERAKLIEEKDNLFLSIEDEKAKTAKIKKLQTDIEKKEKEIESAKLDIKIEDQKFFTAEKPKPISLWKDGESLYVKNDGINLGESLKNEKISALIYGTIKNISGYMVINVKLDTGINGLKIYEFSDAGKYEDAEKIVKNISLQIYNAVQNTKETKIYFDIQPENAKLYINNKMIKDFSKPINLHRGLYDISVSAEEYISASKKIEIKDSNAYALKINLQKLETAKIGFTDETKNPHIFFKSQYTASVPGIINIPKKISILEFMQEDINTFGYVDGNKIGSSSAINNMIIKLNKKNVKKSIELQRKILYWSLGAFYVTLPVTMILGSIHDDQYTSFMSNKLKKNQETVNRINRLGMTHGIFQGITITLGINYFIQLILYLVKADKSLPRKINKNIKVPEYSEEDFLKKIKPLTTQNIIPTENKKTTVEDKLK